MPARIKPFQLNLYFLKYTIKQMAGIASKLNKCTPIDMPIKYEINTNQRMAPAGLTSSSSSHFKIAQKTTAVQSDDIA